MDDQTFSMCLSLFRDFPGMKCLVPGNHDVWIDARDMWYEDSWQRYRSLQARSLAEGFRLLDGQPVMIGETGFAGSMGWYDGSFRDDLRVPESWYASKSYTDRKKRRTQWGDADNTRWPYTDKEVTDLLAARLMVDFEKIKGAKEVVVIFHHLPTSRLLFRPRWLVPRRQRFFDAFMGSDLFGRIIQHPNVTHAFCGHVHLHRTARIGHVRAVSVGSTYVAKELLAYDGARIASRTFQASSS
jgi:hypothetical protein